MHYCQCIPSFLIACPEHIQPLQVLSYLKQATASSLSVLFASYTWSLWHFLLPWYFIEQFIYCKLPPSSLPVTLPSVMHYPQMLFADQQTSTKKYGLFPFIFVFTLDLALCKACVRLFNACSEVYLLPQGFICHLFFLSVSWFVILLFLSRMKEWGISVPTVSLQGSAPPSNCCYCLRVRYQSRHPFSLCYELTYPLRYFGEMRQAASWNIFLCFSILLNRTFSSLANVTFYLILNCSK